MATMRDVVIVGGGPAGLSAGIYAARAGLDAVLAEMSAPGGQISVSSVLENYPGISTTTGLEFGDMLLHHAEGAGCSIIRDEVTSIKHLDDGTFETVVGGEPILSRVVIYAAGAKPRLAGFEGEDTFTGRGVSYCATCDGMIFRNKPVYVVGSGEAACEEAEFLARVASHVTMLVRGTTLKSIASLRGSIMSNPKIDVRFNTKVKSLEGDRMPDRITLENTKTGDVETIAYGPGAFGVFVFVGYEPRIELVESLVEIDNGAVATNVNMHTKTPGLFAAGDVRDTVLRQAVTAVSDGAVAAMSASRYLDGLL